MERRTLPYRRRAYFIGIWAHVVLLIVVPIGWLWSGQPVYWQVKNGVEHGDPIFASVMLVLLISTIFWWLACARPLRCPQCRSFLRGSPNRIPNKRELYICKRCQIEWDTGVPIADG